MTIVSPLDLIYKHINVNFYRSIAILNCSNTDAILLAYELLCHHVAFFDRKIIVLDFSRLFSMIKLHGITNRLNIDLNAIKKNILMIATPTNLNHFEHIFKKVNELIDENYEQVTLFWWFPVTFFKKNFKSINILREAISDFFSTIPYLTANNGSKVIVLDDMLHTPSSYCSDPFDISKYVECTIKFTRNKEIEINNSLKIKY